MACVKISSSFGVVVVKPFMTVEETDFSIPKGIESASDSSITEEDAPHSELPLC